jgi:hypothetical protein
MNQLLLMLSNHLHNKRKASRRYFCCFILLLWTWSEKTQSSSSRNGRRDGLLTTLCAQQHSRLCWFGAKNNSDRPELEDCVDCSPPPSCSASSASRRSGRKIRTTTGAAAMVGCFWRHQNGDVPLVTPAAIQPMVPISSSGAHSLDLVGSVTTAKSCFPWRCSTVIQGQS